MGVPGYLDSRPNPEVTNYASPPEPKLKTEVEVMASFIEHECDGIKKLLLSKNKKYGSSASRPAGMFANSTALEQIAVRCDDKLSRIKNMGGLVKVIENTENVEEDTVRDLIGYLVLACAVLEKNK